MNIFTHPDYLRVRSEVYSDPASKTLGYCALANLIRARMIEQGLITEEEAPTPMKMKGATV
jgi:hypothetical protein